MNRPEGSGSFTSSNLDGFSFVALKINPYGQRRQKMPKTVAGEDVISRITKNAFYIHDPENEGKGECENGMRNLFHIELSVCLAKFPFQNGGNEELTSENHISEPEDVEKTDREKQTNSKEDVGPGFPDFKISFDGKGEDGHRHKKHRGDVNELAQIGAGGVKESGTDEETESGREEKMLHSFIGDSGKTENENGHNEVTNVRPGIGRLSDETTELLFTKNRMIWFELVPKARCCHWYHSTLMTWAPEFVAASRPTDESSKIRISV